MTLFIEYEKSFAIHNNSIYWSSKNKGLPEDYPLNSHKKFIFNCNTCGHEFEKKLHDINGKGGWCPYCSKSNKRVCSDNSCKKCFTSSFASHPKSIYWSKNNLVNPRQVLLKTHKKYKFDCPNCNHEFKSILSDITSNGSWCSYCANRTLCEDTLNCNYCLNKTFHNNFKALYWSDKNKLKPYEVFKSTSTKYWFNCDKCNNIFESKLSHVTNGSWCPNCTNKTEQKFLTILKDIIPDIKCQVKFDWCKLLKHLPFDFVVGNIIIELDGEQHMKQVGNWKTPQHNRERDLYKMNCANKNGYSIIRILQNDVFYDKYDWVNELLTNIEKIEKEGIIQNIYMCKKDEYKNFDKVL